MSERDYYEVQLKMINDKMYEQERCLKATDDIKVQSAIRFRMAKLDLERQYLEYYLKKMR